jgi:peptidoglycan/LPS O-acetylase OafA/YrhL
LDTRVTYLDGVRGWAAVAVLLDHAAVLLLGYVVPVYQSKPFAPFTDGVLAVHVFFVLSGFALSIGFVRTRDPRLVRALALRRYVRLTIPILAVCVIAYLLMRAGLIASRQASPILRSGDWLGLHYGFQPSFPAMLKFALFDVYFDYSLETSYNSSLWTMSIELYGSLLVLALLALAGGLGRARIGIYLLVGAVLYATHPEQCAFILGMLLAEASEHPWVRAFRHRPAALIPGLLLAGVSLACSLTQRRHYGPDTLPFYALGYVAAPVLCARIASLFQTRLSAFLGRISFSLYLVHILVICSLSSWLVLWLTGAGMRIGPASAIVLTATVAVSLVCAVWFHRIEAWAIELSRAFSRWAMEPESDRLAVVRTFFAGGRRLSIPTRSLLRPFRFRRAGSARLR